MHHYVHSTFITVHSGSGRKNEGRKLSKFLVGHDMCQKYFVILPKLWSLPVSRSPLNYKIFFFLHVFWNNLEYIKYNYIFLCVPDILAQGAAATHQVAGQVPDQEHERADGGRRAWLRSGMHTKEIFQILCFDDSAVLCTPRSQVTQLTQQQKRFEENFFICLA